MKEIEIDRKDYEAFAPETYRKAVRGVICRDGRYLLVSGKYGDWKFPGGGMKTGETQTETLIREVKEETGYDVLPESLCPYLTVHERRAGSHGEILVMDSFYYFCEVGNAQSEQDLDPYEQEYGYQVQWHDLETAAAAMEALTETAMIPWTEREIAVMHMLIGHNIWRKMYRAALAVRNPRRVSDYVTCGEVSAAVLSKSGNIYTGVCVDTCSTLGICAERAAIFAMLAAGEQEIDKVLAILPDGTSGAPCGACRELMVQLNPKTCSNIEIMMDMETERTVKLGEITPAWWINME
ncbi:MAG: NUDIX domain-containing protein [Oscillospiraceae bacterium]|nr:NUDIX domain-containing protein [Oscillospiraceae bacterium]